MFISDDIFFKKLQNDALQLFEKKGDDLFLTYLTNTRVFIYSMILFEKNNLTIEEREEFGFLDDVDKCFDSIEREELLNAITYLVSNYTYTAYQQIIVDAYDTAIKAYERGYEGKDKERVLKVFKKYKQKILKQFAEQLDNEKFFDLYQDLLEHAMSNKEKKTISKDLKKKFKELVVWDIKYIRKEIEGNLNAEV